MRAPQTHTNVNIAYLVSVFLQAYGMRAFKPGDRERAEREREKKGNKVDAAITDVDAGNTCAHSSIRMYA